MPGAEQAREPHPVALADRQLREPPPPVADRAERRECHVDPPVRVPGAHPFGRAERRCVRVKVVAGQGVVERPQHRPDAGEFRVDDIADGTAAGRAQLLLGDPDRAEPLHGARVGLERPGEELQQR